MTDDLIERLRLPVNGMRPTLTDGRAAADALTAAQARIAELERALSGCLTIIDALVEESGREIEFDSEDPFRMGEWFEPQDLKAIEEAREALKTKGQER